MTRVSPLAQSQIVKAMPDSQWETLKEVFHAALALPSQQRPTFLDQATNGDADLRRAVESLLQSHEATSHFVDAPAYKAAAEMLVDDADFKPNQIVGHYRIISLLGEGGMGTVYLAEDTKLHRRVALKFLSLNFTRDEERLLRFEHEARAASALNHPNILTIHEIGESEDRRYIATEFIEGETLRKRLATKLELHDIVQIAIQIASALVAAHRVGVVHRDIKPENIMIRSEDGLVKVLDFGLAKTSELSFESISRSADKQALSIFKTATGMVLGTVAYMSPEQARGEVVDARTDIWSLGAVLFEMLTGTLPFVAATSKEMIAAIVSKATTPSVSAHAQGIPAQLQEIVATALNKNIDERYQSSQQLLKDLKSVNQSLKIDTDVQPLPSSLRNTSLSNHATITNPENRTSPSTSSAEFLLSQFKAHRRGAVAVGMMLLLLIAAVVSVYEWRAKHTVAAASAAQIKSLAVLPLKSFDKNDSYLGAGIASAVITKLSQASELTVKPASAVLRFQKEDADSLTAARQLNVDAVLEGTIQRAEDRLRVSVNLLRSSDGASLWAEKFDMASDDIFAIEDKVGNEVAKRLELPLDSSQRARLNAKYPTNPVAYEAYIKGVFSLDQRGDGREAMQQMQTTIDYFKRAIEADPDYAPAHAQLAFAYVWTAMTIDPNNPKWESLAREELDRCQSLAPQLPETHYARALLLWTAYGGYQNAEAIRELLIAKRLDPQSAHPDLPAIYQHCGLDDLAAAELKRALEIDPTSQSLKDLTRLFPYLQGKPDEWLVEMQKIDPSASTSVWYLMRKGKLNEAEKELKRAMSIPPNPPAAFIALAMLRSLKGDFSEALRGLPEVIAKVPVHDQTRHHKTYDVACIYAIAGRSAEAVKWLKETANSGFPNYPLFERDPYLNRVRKSKEFIQFMAEEKANWEKLRDEFSK